MTGTASVLYDYTDNINKKSHNISLLSSWLFGKINTDCLLLDISLCGGAILVPEHQSLPGKSFDLVIMSPENKEEVHTVVQAQQRWIDEKFSSTYKKLGFSFENIDMDKHLDIKQLLNSIKQESEVKLVCSMLNY